MLSLLSQFAPLLAAVAGAVAVHLADSAAAPPATTDEPLTSRWPGPWTTSPTEALQLAEDKGRPILVYAHDDTFACHALERACGQDALLRDQLGHFVLLDLDVRGPSATRALIREYEIRGVPFLGATDAQGLRFRLDEPDSSSGGPSPIVPITGGLYEPIGLTTELERVREGRRWTSAVIGPGRPFDDILRALLSEQASGHFVWSQEDLDEALAAEDRPNGPLHRLARLRAAFRTHTVEGPADAEGTIEQQLLIEDDRRILYHGWSTLASVFELRSLAAEEDPDGTYRDVDATRWRRRMRSASRQAWIGCPDDLVVPFGALLIERYGRDPEDLDSVDRIFCRAVLRTLQEQARDNKRVVRAAEVVSGL